MGKEGEDETGAGAEKANALGGNYECSEWEERLATIGLRVGAGCPSH